MLEEIDAALMDNPMHDFDEFENRRLAAAVWSNKEHKGAEFRHGVTEALEIKDFDSANHRFLPFTRRFGGSRDVDKIP